MTYTASTDRTLSRLRAATSANPGDLDAWLQLERALIRAGQSGAETFTPVFELLQARLDSAVLACEAFEARNSAEIDQRYKAAMAETGADRVCVACDGRGYTTVHVHSSNAMIDTGHRVCDACTESYSTEGCGWGEWHSTVKRADYPKRYVDDRKVRERVTREVRRETAAESDQLHKRYHDLRAQLAPYKDARKLTKGARVRYSNKRARAKFGNCKRHQGTGTDCKACDLSGTKVPLGTEGEVFWTEDRNEAPHWSYSPRWVTKLGLRTDCGAVFFTSASNCDPEVINAWDRLRGQDKRTLFLEQQEQAKEEQRAADQARILAVFGATAPKRGQPCKLGGTEGKVFWVGEDRKTGRLRIGIKRRLTSREDQPTWGFAADAEGV